MADWNPDQYQRFAAERRQPFDELVDLCHSVPDGTVVDYGCGPGNLTAELVDRLQAGTVVGVDNSPSMLERAEPHGHAKLRFEAGDLDAFSPDAPVDLVFSNAALHWVDDHAGVLARWRRQLAANGQLAVQVPTNLDHPVYAIAGEVADEFAPRFAGGVPEPVVSSVLAPEAYAQILYDLGGVDLHVGLRVYCHELDTTADAVQWIKGTSLLRYRDALDPADYDAYEEAFTAAVVDRLGVHEPYLFTFKRILMWARFPETG
ncbi:MAG: methyltransferase domain-containing protein [Acidimicrobiales bacterium]